MYFGLNQSMFFAIRESHDIVGKTWLRGGDSNDNISSPIRSSSISQKHNICTQFALRSTLVILLVVILLRFPEPQTAQIHISYSNVPSEMLITWSTQRWFRSVVKY